MRSSHQCRRCSKPGFATLFSRAATAAKSAMAAP
jgi:hypothetical protein